MAQPNVHSVPLMLLLVALPISAGWESIFEDNFDSLNTKNWNISANARDNAQFLPENVAVKNGQYVITTKVQTYGSYKYTSGGIESQHKHAFHPKDYGGKIRIEASIKLPKGKGIWPAFWTLPDAGGWPPEIDILETLGLHPSRIYMSYHFTEAGTHKGITRTWEAPWDYSVDFHRYAVVWTPDSIMWEIDGVERAKEKGSALSQLNAQYLILYTQMGLEGWDGNWPPDDAALPAYTYVDWVRVSKWTTASTSIGAKPAEVTRRFTALVPASHLVLPPLENGSAWDLLVYDLQGKPLRSISVSHLMVDLEKDLGLAKGVFLVRATPHLLAISR